MRERFGDWGAGLLDADFACALAAAGALSLIASPGWTAERWADVLSRSAERDRLFWRFVERSFRFDPALLVDAWRMFQARRTGRDPIKLFLVNPLDLGSALDWVTEQLSRPEVGASVEAVFDRAAHADPESKSTGSYSTSVDDEPDATPPIKTGYPVFGEPPPFRREHEEPEGGGYPKASGTLGRLIRLVDEGEGGGGTDPGPRSPTPAKEEVIRARFLQAQLEDRTDPESPKILGSLRPGRSYRAVIRVGQSDREWTAVEKPFPVPQEPPEPEGHRLTVIFWEPRVSPEPQVHVLWLPPKGNSKPIFFPFEVPEGAEAIAARITVLHRNRVLQTGLLRAAVGRRRKWTFRLDATPRTRLEGLSSRTTFDAALILNHDDEGTPRLTAASGDQAAVISLDDGPLAELTRYLKNRISAIADEPERYAGLSSPGTVELLRTLAQKGGALHEHLCLHTDLAILADAKRIHLTSAKAGSFFPVELLYRFEPPEDTAGLCPNAAVALKDGTCPGDCPADKRQHVCPLGFWGLSRIIERHAHQRVDQKIDGDFLLRPEPIRDRSSLPLSNRSLLAASGKTSEVKKEAIEVLVRALGERGEVWHVATWEDWTDRASSSSDPTLLVLLPHHEQLAGEEFLEIGTGDRLKSELVRIDHVRRKDGPYPILLLLGCETNLARIAFDNFVTRFRDKGAAIVVSTIATILGRHASPAAARLVELLDEEAREGNSTFGEVMVRLRRRLLETESPMALGLTAYGDADWVLTRAE